MKLKTFCAALLVAGLAVSVAVAAPPPGKGKPGSDTASTTTTSTTTARPGKGKGSAEQRRLGCKPVVSLVLKGEYVSGGTGSFAMLVQGANRHARELKGKQATLQADAATTVKRRGHATLADLVAGDRLVVQARACKARRGETSQPVLVLLARRVVATPAKGSAGDGGGSTTTGSTTTS